MRYRESIQTSTEAPVMHAPTTDDFVELTVGLTLICGVLLLGGGLYGRQRWLQIWGALTLVACAVYYVMVGAGSGGA